MASHVSIDSKQVFETIANKKTLLQFKARNTQLQKELQALTKAEHVDRRSQLSKELQFRTKYEKYLTRGNFETSLIKKDGFKRAMALQSKISTSNLNFGGIIPLHKLIYTNGEVDIEKVLCLHLLSVQYVNSNCLTINRNLRLFPKRSKPNMLEASALPFYILEIIHQVDTDIKIELTDGQDAFILVNSSLERLILSILEVLAIVSPQKLHKIKELSLNKKSIQEMMAKAKILNFLAQLKDCPVLLKIRNYRLEIAQYHEEPCSLPNLLTLSHVRVKDKSKKLELILSEIKKVVNKSTEEDITNSDSWSMFHRKLCSCRQAFSRSSLSSENAIALLSEDGTEFAVVTGTGCRPPTGSAIFCPSLTAIIKSSPRQHSCNTETGSGFSLHPKAPLLSKNEQHKLISSLLHKVNNSHRILIGKKTAEFKSQNVFKEKLGKQKTPINKIMENVFSKQSLISFASGTEHEELKLLFQPCCKGGLGIGSYILEPESIKSNKQLCSRSVGTERGCKDGAVPQIIRQERSIMNTAFIKQDIFTSETRTKMKLFLLSDNPGYENKLIKKLPVK